jgi:hypothetical protein
MSMRQRAFLAVIFTGIFGFTYTEAQVPAYALPTSAVPDSSAASAAPSAAPSEVASIAAAPASEGSSVAASVPADEALGGSPVVVSAPPVVSEAPSAAASAPSSDIGKLAADAVHDTKAAITSGNKLASWLVAASSILWLCITILRRRGLLTSRRAVAGVVLIASGAGVVGAQMAAGVSALDAGIFALTGPCAIALNELLRTFGFAPSDVPTLAAVEIEVPSDTVDRT